MWGSVRGYEKTRACGRGRGEDDWALLWVIKTRRNYQTVNVISCIYLGGPSEEVIAGDLHILIRRELVGGRHKFAEA